MVSTRGLNMRYGTLIAAAIYLELLQKRYMLQLLVLTDVLSTRENKFPFESSASMEVYFRYINYKTKTQKIATIQAEKMYI